MFLHHRKWILFISLALLTCVQLAYALPSDSEQRMRITANETLVNYKTGANHYEGNVKIDQGSTHLTSDTLNTQSGDKHKIQEAIAYGTLYDAHYWTLPKDGDQILNAYAKVIKFYPQKSLVVLEGNVFVTQGKNSFHGPIMVYNIKDQTFAAPARTNGRATIIIEPQLLS